MPPKRKFSDTEPEPAIPASLPPSVEEAYRRKCVQLKNRTNEVEDANDAARIRLARIKRQVEKLRMERAFLLEQLAKRTSTNVEDSEGSPSPPPTPKDKPLRIKRGHRKSALMDLDSKPTATSPSKEPASPSESQAKGDEGDGGDGAPTNGIGSKLSKKTPKTAFELYCLEARPGMEEKLKDEDGDVDIDEELARAWDDLPAAERDDFQKQLKQLKQVVDKAKRKAGGGGDTDHDKDKDADDETPEKDIKLRDRADTQDEDVEMTNYDTDDQEQDGEAHTDKDGGHD